jgi:predicted MFS family arabinose efflux permease
LSKVLPDDAEAGGGLMVAVVQLSITLGASVGGLLFDGLGCQTSFGASAFLLILSAALAFLASRRAAATNARSGHAAFQTF